MSLNITEIDEEEKIIAKLNESIIYLNCTGKPTVPGSCPRDFDKHLYLWLEAEICWPETPPGETANHSCPNIPLLTFDPSRFAYKSCLENGTWFGWTNYTQCIDKAELEFLILINKLHVIGYCISLVALIIALWIFITFRTLRCTRITIHMQLFTSFILNNIMWIIWYERIIPDTTVTTENPLWCQIVHVLKEYFMVANYMWMLCEGLHLHLALVVVFVREERTMKWFFVVGWGFPVIIVAVHSFVRKYYTMDTDMCWIEEASFSSWFLSIPVLITLVLSKLFLINVLRVILTIMHPNSSNPAPLRMRRAVRAALILIPLFGLQYVLLPKVPDAKHPLYHSYLWLSLAIVPLQGLCCSCLFCFANQDVHQAIRNSFHRLTHRNMRWSNYYYTGAADSAAVYVVNGHNHSRRKSTDMTKL